MRYTADHRARTRARIVECAARRFRQDGYAAAGIAEIMGDAGLTVGGFYAHFAGKEELFAEAITLAGAQALADRSPSPEPAPGAWVHAFVGNYLSAAHIDGRADGCPLAALGADLARAGDAPRASYRDAAACFADTLAAHLPGPAERRKSTARAVMAMCVGALTLARAGLDEEAAGALFASCGRAAADLVEACR